MRPLLYVPERQHLQLVMYFLDVTPMGLGVYETMILESSSRFDEEKSGRRYISSIEAATYPVL